VFVGHTAVALAAKSRAPEVPLGWLVAAAFGLDLLWPIFLLTGLERVSIVPGATAFTPLVFDSYPWSHSLLMACAWGLCAAALVRWRGMTGGVALLVGGVVVSHWVLDFVTHAPDMPLWPGSSPRVGLGLWRSVPATLLVEGALFVAGIALYARATRPADRIGSIGLWTRGHRPLVPSPAEPAGAGLVLVRLVAPRGLGRLGRPPPRGEGQGVERSPGLDHSPHE
jgi:membrane-bound metal-dependent hydrolase YbcI (DUF457 family)